MERTSDWFSDPGVIFFTCQAQAAYNRTIIGLGQLSLGFSEYHEKPPPISLYKRTCTSTHDYKRALTKLMHEHSRSYRCMHDVSRALTIINEHQQSCMSTGGHALALTIIHEQSRLCKSTKSTHDVPISVKSLGVGAGVDCFNCLPCNISLKLSDSFEHPQFEQKVLAKFKCPAFPSCGLTLIGA